MAAIAPKYSWGDPNRGASERRNEIRQFTDTGEAVPYSRSALRVALDISILLCVPTIYLAWLIIGALIRGDLGFVLPWR